MGKFFFSLALLAVIAVLVPAVAVPATKAKCTAIQDGTLIASDGTVIQTGYDSWGYNYQAHEFNGYYCDAYRNAAWCQPWAEDQLAMKWNDAWLSNKDCDGDGKLDRYYGYPTYIGSGAWLTNHQRGEYQGSSGEACQWEYFVKIVAVPSDATLKKGMWYSAAGDLIGPVIWGSFAVIQEVNNDPCGGMKGLAFKAARPGLGNWED